MEATQKTDRCLKGEIKRQVGLKNFEKDRGATTEKHLIKSWSVLSQTGVVWESIVWDYIRENPTRLKINSKDVAIKTHLDDYTDKKGNTKKAHYTINNVYCGSVYALGEEPTYYDGWFVVIEDLFEIDYEKLKTAENLNGVFIGKAKAAEKREKEAAVVVVAEVPVVLKRTIKLKIRKTSGSPLRQKPAE
jgi:hypothetical protein